MSTNLEERVEELETRVEELEGKVSDANVMHSESDMESFLQTVSPGTHVERATAIGYYLIHEDNMNLFSSSDIEKGYEDCRIPKPTNLSDVLAGAEERGWVMRTGTKGQTQLWTVTRDGDTNVNSGFEQ